MPEREFDLYLDLLARLLRMSPGQKEAIASELRDHLEARFEQLVREGTPRDKAIRQALEEFGDTAGLAHQFTQLSRREMRRWIMRGTLATAVVGAVVLLVVNAFLPERAGGPAPQPLAAQEDAPPSVESNPVEGSGWEVEYIDPARFVHRVHPDLAQPIDAVFEETPLAEAMEWIDREISLSVVLDGANLRNDGVSLETPVSERFPDDALYDRLNRVLTDVGGARLGWYLSDDVLVVTTANVADEHLQTVFHNVHDLLATGFPIETLINTVQNHTSGPWYDLDAIGGTMATYDLIRDMLIVRHRHDVQIEVATFLEVLRSRADECMPQPAEYGRLETALDRAVNVDFQGLPLAAALSELSALVSERIELDVETLEQNGIAPDVDVSLRMSDRPLRTVLRFMLDDVGDASLSAVIRDGRILITTTALSEESMRPVLYDVTELIGDDFARSNSLFALIWHETSGPWAHVDGIGGAIDNPLPGRLIIQQTDGVHLEVRSMIRRLRELTSATADGDPKNAATPASVPTDRPGDRE